MDGIRKCRGLSKLVPGHLHSRFLVSQGAVSSDLVVGPSGVLQGFSSHSHDNQLLPWEDDAQRWL